MLRTWFAGTLVVSMLSLAVPASAQLRSEAAIIGQVVDESKAVLPGVTVTATSPALQVPSVTAITDEQGEYRLLPLPIGVYTVEYQLSGFQTVRHEEIRLNVGFTARLDIVLGVGGLEETITVSGQSPLIDTTVASTSTQVTREVLENVPTSRNSYIGLMQHTPGTRPPLDVGGSTNNLNPAFRAFGQSDQAWQMIDGVMTSNPRIGDSGNYFDFNTFEEATVSTVGHDASIGARGVAVNTVIKTGSNDFHGSLFLAGTSHQFEADPEDEGGNLNIRNDYSGELGGRILRDKLWFWYGMRGQKNEVTVIGCTKPDGEQCTTTNDSYYFTPKLTYQMSPNNRFSGFYMWVHRQDIESTSALIPWEARRTQTSPWGTPTNAAWKLDWTRVQGQSLTWNAMAGQFFSHSGTYSEDDNFNLIHKRDRTTGRRLGLIDRAGERTDESRMHYKTVVSYFARQGGASHDIKTGFDYFDIRGDRDNVGRGPAKDYRLDFDAVNGVPFAAANRIFVYNYPVFPDLNIKYFAFYMADDFTINRRLTLNIGLRYAHDSAFEGENCREDGTGPGAVVFPAACFEKQQMTIFNTWSPRLRAVFDLTGNGRSVLKGGWGRYYATREADDVFLIAKNNLSSASFRWRDLNGNGDWDFGESNLDLNGSDFLSRESSGAGGGLQNAVNNPDEVPPKTDEFLVQFEQQLTNGLAVRATGIYSKATDSYRLLNIKRPYEVFNIPITNRDPGPDGIVNNADDPGNSLTFYDYAPQYAGLANQQPMLYNDPLADRDYKSMEVAVSRRLQNNWMFRASYSATKIHEPFPIAYTAAFYDPNAEINTLNDTWEWGARASGSYQFKWDVLVSGNFEHRSGDPFARTVRLRGGTQVPDVTVRAELIGEQRYDNINLMDIRVQKAIRFGTQQLQLRANFFNLTNTQVVTESEVLSGPTYGTVTGRVLPRIVSFEAQYKF